MLSITAMNVVATVIAETRAALPMQDREAMQEALDMLTDRFAAAFADDAERADFKAKAGHAGETDDYDFDNLVDRMHRDGCKITALTTDTFVVRF